MMSQLEKWSNGDRPSLAESARLNALKLPLKATTVAVDISQFMGKWYVMANIPMSVEVGATNSVENYTWNTQTQSIDVLFEYVASGGNPTAPKSISEMHAKVVNGPVNSFWALNPKVFGIYLPLGLSYLILDVATDGSYALIGVPDRQYLWVLTRLKPTIKNGGQYKKIAKAMTDGGNIVQTAAATDGGLPIVTGAKEIFELDSKMEDAIMFKALSKAKELGYDDEKVLLVGWTV
jgi:apolipoprotein D and lipocalin family protein